MGLLVLEGQTVTSVRRFAVVCMGEALLLAPSFRPSGGALEASLQLARHGLHVALCAALEDDARGRAVRAVVREAGVDVEGIELVPPRGHLVTSASRRVVPLHVEDVSPLSVPDAFSYELLLVSGLAPSLVPTAALIRAARAARRSGALVVVDVNARRSQWRGQDPRQIHALLREADVVRCSTDDLVSLWTDSSMLAAVLRPAATFVLTDGPARAHAVGPFGEVHVAPPEILRGTVPGAGDAFTAGLCHELLRSKSVIDWEHVLGAAHRAAHARILAG